MNVTVISETRRYSGNNNIVQKYTIAEQMVDIIWTIWRELILKMP